LQVATPSQVESPVPGIADILRDPGDPVGFDGRTPVYPDIRVVYRAAARGEGVSPAADEGMPRPPRPVAS